MTSHTLATVTTSMPQPSKAKSGTPPQDWVEEKKILEHRPLKITPWSNLIIIPMIGQIIQATLFMLLVFGFFMGFSSVAVFSGLSFVATTSSDEKYARSFLKPMIERIKHILIIRDIYLGLLIMPKNEVLLPFEEEKSTKKEVGKV